MTTFMDPTNMANLGQFVPIIKPSNPKHKPLQRLVLLVATATFISGNRFTDFLQRLVIAVNIDIPVTHPAAASAVTLKA
jgi:hypothetical protein